MFNRKEYYKQYYLRHKEKRNGQDKQWQLAHKEELKEYRKQYYQEHKESQKEKAKQYYQEHAKQRRINNPKKQKNMRNDIVKLPKVNQLTKEEKPKGE